MIINKNKNIIYLLNLLCKNGEKEKGLKIILNLFFILKKEIKNKDPKKIFFESINNCRPLVYYRTMYKGRNKKKAYKKPIYISLDKSNKLGIRWLLKNALLKKKGNLSLNLSKEILDSYYNKGLTIKKKESIYEEIIKNKFRLKKVFKKKK